MSSPAHQSRHTAISSEAEAKTKKLVGGRIRHLRKAAGMTLEDLVAKTGISVGALGEIERGEANPRLTTLLLLVAGLDLPSIEWLIDDPPAMQSQPSRRFGEDLASLRKRTTLQAASAQDPPVDAPD